MVWGSDQIIDDSILSVNKIYLKHDQEFKLKLFVEGKFDNIATISELVKPTKFYSFESNIIKTTSELTEINMPEINSNVFRTPYLFEKLPIKNKIYFIRIIGIRTLKCQNLLFP